MFNREYFLEVRKFIFQAEYFQVKLFIIYEYEFHLCVLQHEFQVANADSGIYWC